MIPDPGTSPVEFFSAYSYYYPLFMAYLWMIGAVFYYFRYERPPKSHRDLPNSGLETPPVLAEYPLVTIVVPCHNEGRDIEDTVEYLLKQNQKVGVLKVRLFRPFSVEGIVKVNVTFVAEAH